MAVMMVVMVVLMTTGSHHGFVGPYNVTPPQIEPPYVQVDRARQPEEYKP